MPAGRRRRAAPPDPAREPMPRVCFQLQVKPDRIAEYRARHDEVWRDMLEALEATGWRNYSLFISGTGMVIGYVECEDFDASRRAMEETEVNARWQAEMARVLRGPRGPSPRRGAAAARRDLPPRLSAAPADAGARAGARARARRQVASAPSARSRTRTSSCTPARRTRSWARTAPASRRSSRSSPASTGPTAAGCCSTARR